MNHQTLRTNRFLCMPIAVLIASTPAVGQVDNETYKLEPVTGSLPGEFGYSIALDNGLAVIGTKKDTTNGSGAGSAFLFDLASAEQLLKLLPENGAVNDFFGSSIAMKNGVVVVGAPENDTNGSKSGSAYLFDGDPLSPTFGEQLMVLLPNDGAAGDEFGFSVAISNGVATVGAPFDDDQGGDSGSVYFFDADPDSPNFGNQISKLVASDANGFDEFGFAVASDDGLLVVGAWHNINNSGAAYIIDADPLSPGFGDELAFLSVSGIPSSAEFGRAVSIGDQMIAVGARANGLGEVYLFDADPLSPSFGTQTMRLSVGFEDVPAWFGFSVSINNGQVAVGSVLGNDNGFGAGVAFLFDATSGEKIAHYLPSDGASFGQFGFSSAIDDGGAVVIGAMGGVVADGQLGSVYVFDGPPFVCTADLTDDGQLNFFDISVFLTLFQFNDPAADFNDDGLFNFFDVSAFLAAFSAGCP